MKSPIKLPAIYRPSSDSLVEVNGITFRMVTMIQLTYDGTWEDAGFYLYVANELFAHFWGYPSKTQILSAFQTYMATKPCDYGIKAKDLIK
jgi:hypothetical protein